MSSRSLGHRAPLLWLALPMMAGLAWGRFEETARPGSLLIFALGLALVALAASQRTWLWAGALSLAMMLAGAATYASHRAWLADWEGRPAREVQISLRVERVFPSVDAKKVTGLASIVASPAHLGELRGQHIYFSLALRKDHPAPLRTAQVKVVGVLTPLPRTPPANSFDGYLADAGMNFRLARGRILAEERPATAYAQFCARAVERFKTILALGLAEKRPQLAALLKAMMLGETHELSEDEIAIFRDSGTMHLFAISGMNIAVIAGTLQVVLLQPLRRRPLIQFVVGTVVLWLFVDITGAAPSAIRAFTMAVFLQGAFALWKPASVLAAMTASSIVVLALAPLQFFSASFVMSYGIVAALLLLGLPLGEAWTACWTPWAELPKATWHWWHHSVSVAWRWLTAALAVGLSTTLVGLLTGVHYFGLLTPGALLTNLAIIPAASSVTLSGFASLLCGLLGWNGGAILFNYASAVVLVVIEYVVRLSVTVPGAFLPAHFTVPWLGGAALAGLGMLMLGGYGLGWRRMFGGFWPPFVLVALVLIFGVKFG